MANIEDKDSKNNGRWTKVEHQKFLLGLQLFGKNWKKIQQLIGTRSGAQIRSHAQKFFLKSKTAPECQQGFDESQDSCQLKKAVSVNSKQISETSQNLSQHSYFLSRIIRATAGQCNINFWSEFIDLGSDRHETQHAQEIKRKDSFVIFDMCHDSKQETALPCVSMLGEPIL